MHEHMHAVYETNINIINVAASSKKIVVVTVSISQPASYISQQNQKCMS